MDYLSKFLFVISAKKTKLLLIVTLFITISLLDAVGIGLIGPFIGLAVKPETIQGNVWLSNLYGYLKLSSINQFIALLGLAVVILFYFKSAYEEEQLKKKYQDYEEYKNTTGRFFPKFKS